MRKNCHPNMNLLEILKDSETYLKDNNVLDPKRSSEAIFSKVLKYKVSDLYLHYDEKISDEKLKIIKQVLERRSKNEPIEYIFSETQFYGCDLFISKDVLIPRQETEILVDLIVKRLEKEDLDNKVLWDVCTGSGCIAIAIKNKFQNLKVHMSDISKKAIDIARFNAKKNSVTINAKLGDLFFPFKNEKADFLIVNPPYVSEKEFLELDKDVKNFEPTNALIAKNDGLEFYEKIADEVLFYIKPGGKIFFEIGKDQGKKVQNIFLQKLSILGEIIQDYSGHDRFFFLDIE